MYMCTCTCISNYTMITRLGVSVTHWSTFLSFSNAALANKTTKIARQQHKGSKTATSQNMSLFFFFQASALTPEVISMKPAQKVRKSSGVLHLIRTCMLILAKRNVLRCVSRYSKVQVPHWTPFCYMLMNKHKNRKLSIYAAEDVLRMYTWKKGTNK